MRAIIYIRFSSKKQERGASRERQLDDCRHHCDRMGWQVIEIIEDLGASAWKGDHLISGNLGRFAQRARNGEFEDGTVLVVEKLDRLSRLEVRPTQRWMEDMTDLGIGIATVDGGRHYTCATLKANVMETFEILMAARLAHKESQNKSERVRDAISRRQAVAVATMKPNSAVMPKWLQFGSNGEVEVVEQRAEIIRDIYRWSAEGIGSHTIATRLNRAGRFTWSNKPWQPSTIYKILDSCTVEGDFQPTSDGAVRGDKLVGFYPRIVEPDLVQQARAAKARRRGMRSMGPSLDFVNVFQGLARCGECNGCLHVQKCCDSRGVIRRYFRCDRAARRAGCSRRKMLPYGRVEAAVLDKMLHLALDDQFFSRPDSIRPLANEVAGLEKLVNDLRQRSLRLIRLLTRLDEPDPLMVDEQAKLRSQIATTEARHAAAKAELSRARGNASPDTHMKRVMEIREAMSSDDLDTAMAARRAVRDAMPGVVEVILSDLSPSGEPMVMVALIGGLIGFRVSAKTGMVSDHYDLTPQIHTNPRLRIGATSYRSDGAARLDSVLRRHA